MRESERVTLTSQRRRDVKRRIHTGREGKKILLPSSLSLLPPLFAHPSGSEERGGIRLAYFYTAFPAVISEGCTAPWVERKGESRRESCDR